LPIDMPEPYDMHPPYKARPERLPATFTTGC
jgi:hypothetical protein